MDRLDAMHVVAAIGDAGSLSAASRQLRMPLPTVSRKLAELEAHLNVRIFIRSTRRLTLTDTGAAYLRSCKRILEDVAEAERAAAAEFSVPQGELVVAAPIVFGRLHVLPVISAFLQVYPEVRVRLQQSDRIVNLLEDHIDVTARIGELRDNGLVATRCGATRSVLCASPDYLSRRGMPRSPAQLATHDLIGFEGLSAVDRWTFLVSGKPVNVNIRPRLVVNTAEAAVEAAIAGVGVTRVLSYHIRAAIQAGTLLEVLPRVAPPSLPINLVYSDQRLLPLKLRAFLDFAAPRLRERLTTRSA